MKKFEYDGKWWQELDPTDFKLFDNVKCLVKDGSDSQWDYSYLLACVDADYGANFINRSSVGYEKCAIPCDPPESRLMTKQELSELLSKGYGVYSDKNCTYAFAVCSFKKDEEDDEVNPDMIIRSWDSTEWIKPTIDIYNKFLNKDHK